MSTYYDNPTLYVKHRPDTVDTANHPKPESVELGAGIIEVGVNVGGLEIPLADLKASDYPQRIEEAQKQSQSQQSQQSPGGDQPQGEGEQGSGTPSQSG